MTAGHACGYLIIYLVFYRISTQENKDVIPIVENEEFIIPH